MIADALAPSVAIFWANDGLVSRRIYTSFGINEMSY